MKIITLVIALSCGLFSTAALAQSKGKLNAPQEVANLMPSCIGFLNSEIGIGLDLSKYGYKQRRKSAKTQKFRKIANRGWNKTSADFDIKIEKGSKNARSCRFFFEYAERYVASSASRVSAGLILKYIKNDGYKRVKTPTAAPGIFHFRRGDAALKYNGTLINGYTLDIILSKY